MIKGVRTMFCSSQVAERRAFIRDKLGFPFADSVEDHGYELLTHFFMPGGIAVRLHETLYQERRSFQ